MNARLKFRKRRKNKENSELTVVVIQRADTRTPTTTTKKKRKMAVVTGDDDELPPLHHRRPSGKTAAAEAIAAPPTRRPPAPPSPSSAFSIVDAVRALFAAASSARSASGWLEGASTCANEFVLVFVSRHYVDVGMLITVLDLSPVSPSTAQEFSVWFNPSDDAGTEHEESSGLYEKDKPFYAEGSLLPPFTGDSRLAGNATRAIGARPHRKLVVGNWGYWIDGEGNARHAGSLLELRVGDAPDMDSGGHPEAAGALRGRGAPVPRIHDTRRRFESFDSDTE
uniref:Uncharacterized protein n=1 Tax=Oryza sativa subsp. japonica TaxID=39947 RepID=Q6H7R4_ORYSJ|nr:hypothetical protein [Oryza sativa Japonica Group]